MAKIKYQDITFRNSSLDIIEDANAIIEEYAAQGYELTLRQLYYQFIARDLFPDKWFDPAVGSKNSDKSYDKLGELISKGRLAGLVDWNAIIDRTRTLRGLSHWESPQSILRSVEWSYRLDKWETQPFRPEVWIEKDAALGTVTNVCNELDIPFFSCRGYTSQSEMHAAAMRLVRHIEANQTPYIIHLGDHDPSGKDMTRDVFDRLFMFITGTDPDYYGERIEADDTPAQSEKYFYLKRIALNYDQVQAYGPPPNPTKLQDSRSGGYIREFGLESWELDALEPRVVSQLIRDEIEAIIDRRAWDKVIRKEEREKDELRQIRGNYSQIRTFLESL